MKPKPLTVVITVATGIAVAWAALSIYSLLNRVETLELILKNRLIDEAVAACNEAAVANDEQQRFERQAIASAQFRMWHLDTLNKEPAADMVLYADGLGCRYSFLGKAGVYGISE